MDNYEVVIIGAGQAGIPLAQELARRNRRTALIERKTSAVPARISAAHRRKQPSPRQEWRIWRAERMNSECGFRRWRWTSGR